MKPQHMRAPRFHVEQHAEGYAIAVAWPHMKGKHGKQCYLLGQDNDRVVERGIANAKRTADFGRYVYFKVLAYVNEWMMARERAIRFTAVLRFGSEDAASSLMHHLKVRLDGITDLFAREIPAWVPEARSKNWAPDSKKDWQPHLKTKNGKLEHKPLRVSVRPAPAGPDYGFVLVCHDPNRKEERILGADKCDPTAWTRIITSMNFALFQYATAASFCEVRAQLLLNTDLGYYAFGTKASALDMRKRIKEDLEKCNHLFTSSQPPWADAAICAGWCPPPAT